MIFLMHKHCVMCGDKCILKYQSQHFTIETNCNILPKTRPFSTLSALCPNAAFRHTQNQPQCPPLPPAAHPSTPLPSTLPSSLTNALPCYKPTFTRRTSGNSQSNKISVPHPHLNNNAVSLPSPPYSSFYIFLPFFVLFFILNKSLNFIS